MGALGHDQKTIEAAGEAMPSWVHESVDNLLRFIFVDPRPCPELDAVIFDRRPEFRTAD